jgi:hypothetical protein
MTDTSHSSPRKKLRQPIDPSQFTPFFSYKPANGGRTLFVEGVSLEAIAAKTGTPAYVYSRASIE